MTWASMPRALNQRASQKPSRRVSKARAMRVILCPAFDHTGRGAPALEEARTRRGRAPKAARALACGSGARGRGEHRRAKTDRLDTEQRTRVKTDGLMSVIGRYEKPKVPVLLDHMGRPDPANGKADPSLTKVIELLKRGNFWAMLSLVEKISKIGPPWNDVVCCASTNRGCTRSGRLGQRLATPRLGESSARRRRAT
jgi:hypothetical protein